jgi:hypothetical protein
MAQRTHPIHTARGRLERTAAEAVQVQARFRVESQRRAAYTEVQELTAQLLELSDQLQVTTDPSAIVELQETARDRTEAIVRLLLGTGHHAPSRRRTDLDLVRAVELLDAVLTLAQQGIAGSRHAALDLALVVRDRVDHLAGVEPALAGAR